MKSYIRNYGYINKGSTAFQRTRRSEYIDKSALTGIVNRQIFTEQQFFSVTRCRRFGKSMAAKMLAAYFIKGSPILFVKMIVFACCLFT